jgi:prefoldin subunit 5
VEFSVGSGCIYSTLLGSPVIATNKEKILRAASVMISAIGLTWSVTTKIGEVAANLDRRLDKLEQSTVELRAEVRSLDRAAHRSGAK